MTKFRGDYFILAILLLLYLGFVYFFQTSSRYLVLGTIVLAFFYVIWGIIHHISSRNFHFRIVLEYLLVAALGVAIIATLLL